jgi:hypothetical protein
MLAVDAAGFKHVHVNRNPGTTASIFLDFIRSLLARLPAGQPRVFMWDNLSSPID